MTEKDINNHLKNGISEIAPNCFEQIMEKIESKEDVSGPVKITKKWTNKKTISYFVSIAACFIVLVSSYGVYEHDKHKVNTIVELDVNPSIEFSLDKSDKVVEVTALNGDGEEIIENLSLQKEDIKEATLIVMDELFERGFITKEKSTVLVSVENENENKTEEIKESLSKGIVEHLGKEDIKITVLKQTMKKDEISESMAKEYNISKGKALLVKTIVEKNPNLKEAQLAQMTVDEIAKQASDENVNIKELLSEQNEETNSKEDEDNKKKVTVTEKGAKDSKGNGTEKTVKVKEGDKKEEPTKTLDHSEKAKPTKAVNNNEKGKSTKTPDNKGNQGPTKIPDNKGNQGPTKIPDNKGKEEPTKTPDNKGKEEPTKIPDNKGNQEPTKIPDNKGNQEPTKIPDGNRNIKPTKIPDDNRNIKPTKIPDDNRNIKPTKVPDSGERPGIIPGIPDGKKGKIPDKEDEIKERY